MNEVLKREEQDLLLVVDSVKEYFDNPSCMEVRSGLANYCMQRGKSCLSVLAIQHLTSYTERKKSSMTNQLMMTFHQDI